MLCFLTIWNDAAFYTMAAWLIPFHIITFVIYNIMRCYLTKAIAAFFFLPLPSTAFKLNCYKSLGSSNMLSLWQWLHHSTDSCHYSCHPLLNGNQTSSSVSQPSPSPVSYLPDPSWAIWLARCILPRLFFVPKITPFPRAKPVFPMCHMYWCPLFYIYATCWTSPASLSLNRTCQFSWHVGFSKCFKSSVILPGNI